MATTNNTGNINPLLNRNMIDIPAKPVVTKKANYNNQPVNLTDRVEISKNATRVNNAVNTVNALPEIRINVVNTAVTQRVENQQRVPAAELAAKMLLEDQ